jgi:hypothetical protein
MEPRNRFQGMNSASLCSLAGRYDNPMPTQFLVPIDCLKIPSLATQPGGIGSLELILGRTYLRRSYYSVSLLRTIFSLEWEEHTAPGGPLPSSLLLGGGGGGSPTFDRGFCPPPPIISLGQTAKDVPFAPPGPPSGGYKEMSVVYLC